VTNRIFSRGMSKFHVVVIGSGPGGYVAAIRAAQLGFNTAVIERERPGGICLNWGCIPTKALLKSAHLLEELKHADQFGLKLKTPEIDFPAIVKRSRNVADRMAKGVQFLMKKNKITVIEGNAKLLDRHNIEVEKDGKKEAVQADKIIIATGARARSLPGMEIDGNFIIGYREALTLSEVPESLCIVGAGAIGIEFADFYTSMGSKVTILEALPKILPAEDDEVSAFIEKSFKKREIEIHTNVKVNEVKKPQDSSSQKSEKIEVAFTTEKGEKKTEQFSKMLLAAGITANTENLNLELLGIKTDRDRILVDDQFKTSVKNIYAIGDCIPGPALAHVASMEGIKAAEAIKAAAEPSSIKYHPMDYGNIPACTYCHPEVASVGFTEKEAKEKGISYKVGRFPFTASGRAQAVGETEGFIKVIVDETYHQILGAHITGPAATELISEYTLGRSLEALAEDFIHTVHAHPTLAEGVMEAAADSLGEAINI